MEKSALTLIIGAGIFLVGITLLAFRKFRGMLNNPQGQNIIVYIARPVNSIVAVVGVMTGINLIVYVKPIVEKYTATAVKLKTEPAVIVHKDTAGAFKNISGNERGLNFDKYAKKAIQDFENYVNQT
jgi:xanthosine utilization system XapX-like protein